MEVIETDDFKGMEPFIALGMVNTGATIEEFNKSAHDGNEPEKRIIIGEISSSAIDEEGDYMLQKGLDFSYFDSNGCIKYEHQKGVPDNIIGFPHKRFTDGNRTIIKGALVPEGHQPMADATWNLIKAIEAHNKQFPKHQKTLGFSVEGFYSKGARKGGIQKSAKITNVVVTPNAIQKTTWLERMEESEMAITKSLNATPTSTNIPDKTGIDAIAGRRIDKDLKTISEAGKRLSEFGYEVKVELLGRAETVSKDKEGSKVKKSVTINLH